MDAGNIHLLRDKFSSLATLDIRFCKKYEKEMIKKVSKENEDKSKNACYP